mgnify:CR=1 FL=1
MTIGSVGIIVTLVLLALLLARELVRLLPGPPARRVGRICDLALIPLLIAFAVVVVAQVAWILGA